jgi:hypothetical protein
MFGKRQSPPGGTNQPKELPIPGEAFTAPSTEIFRAWIVNRDLHVSLVQGFDDPRMWGILLVDIARHAARIYEAEGVTSEAEALESIKQLFDAEWNNMTDAGRTGRARQ